MTDHALGRAQLAEAVGNDIADMAHFWMLRKFQFLEPAREQFEIIVDPWLSYCTEPSQNEIMAYNMAFTDWLLFERSYRHGKTLLELYVEAVSYTHLDVYKRQPLPISWWSAATPCPRTTLRRWWATPQAASIRTTRMRASAIWRHAAIWT